METTDMTGMLSLKEPPKTEVASIEYLAQLDAHIDEVDEHLSRMRNARRVVAELIGTNRREGGPLTQLVDSADRAHFEGEKITPHPRNARFGE
jgi:hypothetical protein